MKRNYSSSALRFDRGDFGNGRYRRPGTWIGRTFAGLLALASAVAQEPAAQTPANVDDERSAADSAATLPGLIDRVASSPDDAGAWRELGWMYWHLDRLDQARNVWENWRRIDPDRAETHDLLGRLALAEDRLGDAIAAFRHSLELDPDQPDVRFHLAQALRWEGFLEESIVRLRDIMAEDPDHRAARLELARALSSNWQYAEALPLWNQLRADEPENLDWQLEEARANLQTGAPRDAVLAAQRVLRRKPGHPLALSILADEADYGGRPQEAAEWIRQSMAATPDAEERHVLRNRLLALHGRMAAMAPSRELERRQIELAREIATALPRDVNARLTLGDLLISARAYDEAEIMMLGVLREFNPRNLRAQYALFEIALARQRFQEAAGYLEAIRTFNPDDPYLAYYEARRYAGMGDEVAAEAALDRLAAAGDRGAAAVLLYHSLTEGEYGPAMSVARFREHLHALMAAGYTFLTSEELHGFWELHGPRAGRHPDGRLRRVVLITFDDALESAMRFGTPIGIDYNIRFSQHIPVGNLERGDPFIASWDQLAGYAASGVWEYGSHLTFASDTVPVDRTGMTRAFAAATRQWLDDAGRLETESEFLERLRYEYAHAVERIEHHLGHNARAVAYPYGDIGQEGFSNVEVAIPVNRRYAARHHQIGFIQAPFAHAVRDNNPLLYTRHEFDQHASGETVARHLMDNHPVILAELTRLQFAQWRGRAGRARHALQQLRLAGYDATALQALESNLRTELAPVFAVPDGIMATVDDDPSIYRIGGEAAAFGDSLKAYRFQAGVQGAIRGPASTEGEVRIGTGRWRQKSDGDTGDVALTEGSAHLSLAYLDARRWLWRLGGGVRGWSGSVDLQRWEGHFEGHGRLAEGVALRAGIAATAPDQAAALARGLKRTKAFCEGQWDLLTDWRLLWNAGWEDWSDGNRILDAGGGLFFEPAVWRGVFIGARAAYRQSDFEASDYWTPRRLQGVYAVMGRRGFIAGGAYALTVQAGTAQEKSFAPTPANADVAVAARAQTEWTGAYGLSAEWNRTLNRYVRGGFRIDWNQSPTYEMVSAVMQAGYRF